ncbi:type VII secretion protein EccB [Streptomyces sp. B-S-A8]|uniref:Type VII secretion protein EccB n=1 Tax=Streptomyces solicavernae TaxID=3043614 RepID=A0ABT6S1T4_9ACTN|nr:type VII secretion protein EccB [Streptomyces sp. B-S-A8]MDI3390414.1 type VII secretion protein EccB [Streptomyces sp. B-S-A8]
MASRRDELNAYTFAKKVVVSSLLEPTGTGTEENAPRPLRAVVPGLVIGALILAGFGAWGMFKPKAPKGWDTPGAKVIVAKESTTRYVVLDTGKGKDKKTLLHPVMNLASARLLLTPKQYDVIQVSDEILDAGKPPLGPILGIPYAPDRLPKPEEAGKAKRWAVCQQPGGGKGDAVQQATFVFAQRDLRRTEGKKRLSGGQVLYVNDKHGKRYLVDAEGKKYPVAGRAKDLLATTLVGLNKEPQQVSDEWLATLHEGSPIDFPRIPGDIGARANADGGLSEDENRVGMVLKAQTGDGPQHYVVLDGGKVQPVSDFTAWLLINSPQTDDLDMGGRASRVDAQSFTPASGVFGARYDWPEDRTAQVNSAAGAGSDRDTVCSVLRKAGDEGATTLSTWAGEDYPAELTAGGTSSYVTPGSGLLYTQVRGKQTRPDGSLFLVTDTGLRYAVQTNGDSDADRSDIGSGGQGKTDDGRPEPSQAQIRLGYGDVTPAVVPYAWSEFLAKGPRLDTNSARQPQGS